jgi:hypothetical protein
VVKGSPSRIVFTGDINAPSNNASSTRLVFGLPCSVDWGALAMLCAVRVPYTSETHRYYLDHDSGITAITLTTIPESLQLIRSRGLPPRLPLHAGGAHQFEAARRAADLIERINDGNSGIVVKVIAVIPELWSRPQRCGLRRHDLRSAALPARHKHLLVCGCDFGRVCTCRYELARCNFCTSPLNGVGRRRQRHDRNPLCTHRQCSAMHCTHRAVAGNLCHSMSKHSSLKSQLKRRSCSGVGQLIGLHWGGPGRTTKPSKWQRRG